MTLSTSEVSFYSCDSAVHLLPDLDVVYLGRHIELNISRSWKAGGAVVLDRGGGQVKNFARLLRSGGGYFEKVALATRLRGNRKLAFRVPSWWLRSLGR